MKNNIILSFLLILIIFFFNRFNCYLIQDVRVLNKHNSQYAINNNCDFFYRILCIPTEIGEDCNPLQFSIQPNQTEILMTNGSASIYAILFEIPIGEYSNTINSIFTINLTCYAIDINALSFKFYSKQYYYATTSSYNGMILMGLYEIEGYNTSLNVPMNNIGAQCINIKFCNFFSIVGNKFLFQISGTLDSNTDYSKVQVQFTLNNTQRIFDLEPIYKNVYDNIYDIKTYPDLQYLNNMTLMGFGETGVIQFKSNNSILSTPYIIDINENPQDTQYHPIYADENSTTYLNPMSSYGPSIYSIHYLNGSHLSESDTFINSNINQYLINKLTNGKTKNYYINNNSSLPFSTFQFSDNKRNEFQPIKFEISGIKSIKKFPLGYTFGDSNGYTFNYSVLTNPISFSNRLNAYSIYNTSGIYEFMPSSGYNLINLPTIYNIELKQLIKNIYLFRIYTKTPYKFKIITTADKEYYGYESLVDGDEYNGVYEIIQKCTFDIDINIYDIYDGFLNIISNSYYSVSPFFSFLYPTYNEDVDFFSIHNVSFLYNNIDVTNHRHYNIMYYNLPDNIPRELSLSFVPIGSGSLPVTKEFNNANDLLSFASSYNKSIGLFQIEFYVEANTQTGEFPFLFIVNSLIYSNKLLDNQLIIKKSNVDLQGPLFKHIKKISNPISINNQFGLIGWSVTIEDPINGFDYGYIAIKGEQDQSIYNITFNSNDVKSGGNQYIGEYDILFNITYPCISQQYIITDVILNDRVSRQSVFSIFPKELNAKYVAVSNPFLYFLNDSSTNKLELQCFNNSNILNDSTAPTLKSFSSSISTIDVGSLNRNVSFSFVSEDLESGLKNYQYPIVYLSIKNARVVECKSKIVEINETTATYTCNIELPIGFGYEDPNIILLSVYGFINNNGLFSGFSTNHLIDLGFSNNINTIFTVTQPLITEYVDITEKGGDLFIIGRLFDNNSTAFITFNDGSKSNIKAIFISTTTIKIPNVKPTKYPYQLFIKTLSSNTNNITITPIIYDYYINQIPEPTFPPTLTPVPTNAPQLCKGDPVCGGPTHGKCIENQGCVCYSPWIGNDCQSQIVIVDPPIFNNGSNNSSSPSIEIIVPENNGNNSSENGNNTTPVTYHSLISIVSLREINIRGDAINTITFKDDWLSKQIEDSTFLFYKEFETKINQETIKSNITATLKWFKNETIIKFAEEELKMYPSTLKYTIQISNYPFENKLNQLQIVMSALIQSNTTQDVCSSKEYGETSAGDNSNYLKIQIDKYSLYGRFIRRGIIDSNIRTITNIQLDSDMNPITQSKSLQSYIGIQIPYFNDLAIIDPDYSILVDSHSATSICSNNSKLSKAKIAGIIIGCVAFVSIIVISVIYHFVKKRKDKKFQKNINQKMKQMNTKDNSNL